MRILACLLCLFSFSSVSAQQARYKGYTESKLPAKLARPLENLEIKPSTVVPPKAEIISLKNGMTLYLVEDHKLPLVDIALLMEFGEVHVPQGKEGLGDVLSLVWRSGGSKKFPGDALDAALEDRAADLSIGVGEEYSNIRMGLMSRDVPWGIELLADMFANPVFPEESLKLDKLRLQEALFRQDDDPGEIAEKLVYQYFYGNNSPWGRSATVASVETISRDDLVSLFDAYVHPSRARLVISGDIDKKTLLPLLEKQLTPWKKKPKALPVPVAPALPTGVQVLYVDMPLPQTTFFVALPSVGNKHPEREALTLVNEIIGGGGFDSLLMEEIRSNRGLAYGVYSELKTASNFGGMMLVGGQTKAESTVESISLALQILQSVRDGKGLTDKNVSRAKDASFNSFVFRFVSSFSIAIQQASYDLVGLPRDYVQKFPERVQSFTTSYLSEVAKKNLDLTRMVIVVVGDSSRFDTSLSALGFGKPLEIPAPNR